MLGPALNAAMDGHAAAELEERTFSTDGIPTRRSNIRLTTGSVSRL
jgi:hypothetical protein